MAAAGSYPRYRQTVLDAVDHRGLAEFYRQLLGYQYFLGEEPGGANEDEEFLALVDPSTGGRLAFQHVERLVPVSWPKGPVPQQLHLDFSVADTTELDAQHEVALALGAKVLEDRSADEHEPLRVYADPAGHPFCLFVLS